MAGFSVGGLATGLDTKTMIKQLMAVERSAQNAPKRRQYQADKRAEAMSDLINLMKEVQTAAEEVDTVKEASAVTATSADTDQFTVTGDGNAIPNNYTLAIAQLARAQKDTATLGTSLTSSVGQGTYSIQIENEDAVEIIIDETNDTLADFITAINSADAKVTASTVFDGTNYTLMITGEESGKEITYSGKKGANWSNLDGNGNGLATYETHLDAMFSMDGIPIISDSNEITSAVTGLTINLVATHEFDEQGVPTSTTTLSVAADTVKTGENIEGLTAAIGKVMSNLTQTMKSSETGAGVLAFDSTARMLRGAISDALVQPQAGNNGAYSSLTMIGIGQDRYGTMTFDKDEFATALAADKDGVMDLITGTDGLAARFKSMSDDYTLSEGFLTSRKSMYDTRSEQIKKSIERMEERVLSYEKRIKHQFAKLEMMVSGLSQQSAALTSLR
jgi:flagellar hook-associated protein 2